MNGGAYAIVGAFAAANLKREATRKLKSWRVKYEAAGKRIQLRHLSKDCHYLLNKAGHLIVDSDDDPDYEIAVDYGVRTGILADSGH